VTGSIRGACGFGVTFQSAGQSVKAEAVSTKRPSGLKHAELTLSRWRRGVTNGFPLLASQSRAERSSEAVTNRYPSELNCAERTDPSCFMGRPSGCPVAASQSRAVLSHEAMSTLLAVRAELRSKHRPFMFMGMLKWLARGCVPDLRRFIP
jgi:hypothetical protein